MTGTAEALKETDSAPNKDGASAPKPIPDFEGPEKKTEKGDQLQPNLGLLAVRRRIGYGLGVFAILAIIALAVYVMIGLHTIVKYPPTDKNNLLYVYVGGHAIVTVAMVFFAYQLLRAAERLVLPPWWADSDPDRAKTMLGIRDPLSQTTKVLDKLVERVVQVMNALKDLKDDK